MVKPRVDFWKKNVDESLLLTLIDSMSVSFSTRRILHGSKLRKSFHVDRRLFCIVPRTCDASRMILQTSPGSIRVHGFSRVDHGPQQQLQQFADVAVP
jgi:hypothetical protein